MVRKRFRICPLMCPIWAVISTVFRTQAVCAPFGVGVLWEKDAMAALSPWQTGGGMVQSVTAEHRVFQPVPFRLEAGTPAVAEVIALGTAIDYLAEIGMSQLAEYESF